MTLTEEEHKLLTECSSRSDPWTVAEIDEARYPAMRGLGRLRLIDASWPAGNPQPLTIWITEFGQNVLKDINVESEKDS